MHGLKPGGEADGGRAFFEEGDKAKDGKAAPCGGVKLGLKKGSEGLYDGGHEVVVICRSRVFSSCACGDGGAAAAFINIIVACTGSTGSIYKGRWRLQPFIQTTFQLKS